MIIWDYVQFDFSQMKIWLALESRIQTTDQNVNVYTAARANCREHLESTKNNEKLNESI